MKTEKDLAAEERYVETLTRTMKKSGVPQHDHGGIIRYIINGIPPGSF